MSDEFAYKTYRCQWEVQLISVDQYGNREEVLKRWPFPTINQATQYRNGIGQEHRWVKDRWFLKDDHQNYQELVIRYREEEIKQA